MYSALTKSATTLYQFAIKPATIFMISTMIVNGGNYAYNLWLGRKLGPAIFSEVGLLLTILLILSFIGMTLQLVSAKFIIELNQLTGQIFHSLISRISLISGTVLMVVILVFSNQLSAFFQLSSSWPLTILSISIPFYFLMSVSRGIQQGNHHFVKLSASYQIEIWSKFGFTVLLLYIFPNHAGIIIALALLFSVISGSFSAGLQMLITKVKRSQFPTDTKRKIFVFAAFTLGYELIQIVINYGDLLTVKHYFDASTAGLYTSISLVGRMVYFLTWMMVMVLIPTVIKKRKEGLPVTKLMYQYTAFISVISGSIVLISFLFPEATIRLLFGEAFTAFAPHLWKYAFATMLFALSNLFIYYFISLEFYKPVYFAGLISIIQLVFYFQFHQTISDIILIQIFGMSCLLLIQLSYFVLKKH